jgi:hypothetical protein
MRKLRIIVTICAVILSLDLYAQNLSVNNKTIKVEELPEYIIINCDNVTTVLSRSIGIHIEAKKSEYEKPLKDLQDLLEDNKYLNISNQTDLLNTMSKLGFDYVDAFPQNSPENSVFSRAGFVFRKKEKYRN